MSMTPRPFRFGVQAPPCRTADEWVTSVRRAEAFGYSTVLLPEALAAPLPAPMLALALAAGVTRTLRLGTYVLANEYRNPVMTAREAASLDRLSNGRFELGIGAGRPGADRDYAMLGIPLDPGGVRVSRLGEALTIIKGMLAGQRVTLHGRYYSVTDAEVLPGPIQQPRPPILVAASGRRMLSLAAREADIVTLGVRPDESQASVAEKVGWAREAAGARFPDLELNLILAIVGDYVSPFMRSRFGADLAALTRSDSPSVVVGSPDDMCAALLARRDALGISYYVVTSEAMETFAPVVEQLTGR
ncbi:MAG: TIGR03621 family F420-dependent LLM class oxidoreductase [Chloroflexi bacterium]|nr:TIGR03621 family F420-dependent LLM class oxidoreductase [Chloroflexota bacterium]